MKPWHKEALEAELHAQGIVRDTRRMFWLSVLQSALCGLVGFAFGLLYAFGWWFEATGGWAR